jgi:hypothetical protein
VLDDDEGLVDEDAEPMEGHAEPPPIYKFRRTAIGSALAAGMLGLRDVLETPKDDEPPIVVDWSGETTDDDPIMMRLDPDNPADSIVVIRKVPHDRAD